MDIGTDPSIYSQRAAARAPAIVPGLTGVSETMLWSLHNRAREAARPDGILRDPAAISIHNAINYDFARNFGQPCGSLAARAAGIDNALRLWLTRHPDGLIVSLGEGLETQSRRVDNGRLRWLTVDLGPAIALRERFIRPTARFAHLPISALSPDWMDAVDSSRGLCIVAQGLLMYFDSAMVEELIRAVAARFAGAAMIFDTIPRWFSRLTLDGLQQTPHYRLPPMPWGIDHDEIPQTLRTWHPALAGMNFLDYRAPRGLHRYLSHLIESLPILRHEIPCLVQLEF
jgi:O-methyltransferase involved in polyketide biosynthesis